MTTAVDIANRALSEIGARCNLTVIDNTTPQGEAVGIWINVTRRQLLRAAPWGFARKTATLEVLGTYTDAINIVPQPWSTMYAYPSDAIKVNYLLPPAPVTSLSVPAVGIPTPVRVGPSRTNRFIVSLYDPGGLVIPAKVLLSNLLNADAVYVADVADPDLTGEGFQEGWVALLASKVVQPLTGNAGMKTQFEQLAKMHVDTVRAINANESITSTDSTPDWLQTRVVGGVEWAACGSLPGDWYSAYDSFSWSM